MEEFHRGPYETAVGDAEMLTEVRIPVRPNGSSAYEKVERRAGDWAVVSAGRRVWMDGDVIADARVGLAAVGAEHHRHPGRSPRRCAASRRPRSSTPQAGAHRRRELQPRHRPARQREYKRHLADELTTAAARCRRVGRPAIDRGGADHAGHDDRQRRRGHPRDRGPAAARALPARPPRPDRHALGLRHQQLRHLRRLDGRRAGEVAARCWPRWPAGTRSAPSRGSSRDGELDPVQRGLHGSATACSAASARPG